MNVLKFSHDYEKLPLDWEGTQAILFAVSLENIWDLSKSCPQFLDYDTKFRGENGNYSFDFEWSLVLFFVHVNSGRPFTTIRRTTPEKEGYYKSQIGETFVLERVKQ